MFLEHDQTHEMSVSYDFSNSLVFHMISQTQEGVHAFVFNCETHYSNDHLVIGNKINRLQGQYVKTIVFALHNKVLIIVYYS